MNDHVWDALMDERAELEAYTFDEFVEDDYGDVFALTALEDIG